jgi:hypothetical protein
VLDGAQAHEHALDVDQQRLRFGRGVKNSSKPASVSSRLSDWLIAGCVTPNKAAALRAEPLDMMARKVSISVTRI